jgi:hypothetical protein
MLETMEGGAYKLRKAPKRELYWVIGKDGTKHSKEPIPRERALAQQKALYASWREKKQMKGGLTIDELGKYLMTYPHRGQYLMAESEDWRKIQKWIVDHLDESQKHFGPAIMDLKVSEDPRYLAQIIKMLFGKEDYIRAEKEKAAFAPSRPRGRGHFDAEYIKQLEEENDLKVTITQRDGKWGFIITGVGDNVLKDEGTPIDSLERFAYDTEDKAQIAAIQKIQSLESERTVYKPKMIRKGRGVRGGQITDEQIERYAPTIQSMLPEFQAGPEPTRGDYERYKRGVEKSQARGMTTRLMSYDEWAKFQRQREQGRKVGVEEARKSAIRELPGLVEGWESLQNDPLVTCPYDSRGNVAKTSMRKSECQNAKDEWEKREHPANYYFFRPVVTGLVKAADFAAENIAPMLPGVGKLAGEVYKGVRGAVGPTEYDGRGHMHFVPTKARRVGGRRVAMRGDGFFGDLWASTKRLATGALERAQAVFKGPRQDFSPSVRRVLAEVGDLPVVEMVIRRDPIQSFLNKALNLISLGRWDALRKEYNYDELFHLGVEVTVRISPSNEYVRRYVIEKNEVINVSPAKAYTDKTTTWRVPMYKGTTINTLLANTKLLMGPNFFVYDPFKNNCQDFIWSLLVANGYGSPELKAIVKQPMEDLISKLPGATGKIAKAITDVGALANVALEGQGYTEFGKIIMKRNAMNAGLERAMEDYAKLYLEGKIAEAEELGKRIQEIKRAIRKADESMQYSGLPTMGPGAAADWSNPKGKGARGGYRTEVDPNASPAEQAEQRAIIKRRLFREAGEYIRSKIRSGGAGIRYIEQRHITKAINDIAPEYRDELEEAINAYIIDSGIRVVMEPAPSAGTPAAPVVPDYRILDELYRGRGRGDFESQLMKADVKPKDYLRMAQRYAQRAGYPYKKVQFSDQPGKKLMIEDPSGRTVHFGATGYNDFLLYSLQGNKQLADEKRRLYLARAQKIKGNWRQDKYSPNSLAIYILWPPK